MNNQQHLILSIQRLILNVPIYDSSSEREQPTEDVRKKIISSGRCHLCDRKGKKYLVHHVIPNGPGTMDNLELLCFTCHDWVHHMLRKMKNYPGSGYRRRYYR